MACSISVDDLLSVLDDLHIQDQLPEPVLIEKNPHILSDIITALDIHTHSTWKTTDFGNKPFELNELDRGSLEYTQIASTFNSTMRRGFTIDKIMRVENPYLLAQYNLKKLKKKCSARTLFHGTKESNITAICQENFNWRLTGTSVGHKFGRGMSFSPSSTYSSHYPRNYPYPQRVMFVADVLIKSACVGSSLMTIPSPTCDTSMKPDGQVLVKYEDNDFYPKYVIYYSQ